MKKISQIFPLVVLIAALFYACCKKNQEERYPLTPEDMKWNPYTSGQKVAFLRNTGARDTFLVTVTPKSWQGDYNNAKAKECGSVLIYFEKVDVYFENKNNIPLGGITLRGDGLYFSMGYHGPSIQRNSLPNINTMTINGYTYLNVYLFQCDTARNNIFTKFYFNKEFGFLKVEYQDGTFYELIK